MLNIGWWHYMPIAESKGALGSVPNVLSVATVFPPSSAPSSYPNPRRHPPSPPPPIYILLTGTVPVPVSIVLFRLPQAYKFQPRLFPPSPGDPQARPPLHLQTQVNNWSCCNVPHDCIMAYVYICLHLIHT